MDVTIIIIIILVIIVIALGVVSFVPFGGKLLMCSSNVSNIVSASNCSIIGYISKSDCPVMEVRPDAESCQTFVDAKECPDNPPEGFYTDTWCKSKYTYLNPTPTPTP